jgi:hypothetical protein
VLIEAVWTAVRSRCATLCWCLLSRKQAYAFGQPTTRKQIRDAERALARYRPRTPTGA